MKIAKAFSKPYSHAKKGKNKVNKDRKKCFGAKIVLNIIKIILFTVTH